MTNLEKILELIREGPDQVSVPLPRHLWAKIVLELRDCIPRDEAEDYPALAALIVSVVFEIDMKDPEEDSMEA